MEHVEDKNVEVLVEVLRNVDIDNYFCVLLLCSNADCQCLLNFNAGFA